MNPEELSRAVAKFRRRKLKLRLSVYSAIITLILCLSPLANGLTLLSLTSCLLFLPLPLYFFFQSLRLARQFRTLKTRVESHHDLIISLHPPRFSLWSYLTQPSFAFRLSLLLFFLAAFTALARARVENPSLASIQSPLTMTH